MKVTLLHHTPLHICSHAIRTCYNSFDKSDNGGEKDKALIYKVGNKLKHSSTLEHLSMSFFIQGISRACLQELVRHRHTSLSVKSSRYTLAELKRIPDIDPMDLATVSGYCVLTDCVHTNKVIVKALIELQYLVKLNVPNDKSKYALPEAYKTDLTWTINIRSLQNYISLRTHPTALWEINDLAKLTLNTAPKDYIYLLEDSLYKKPTEKET